MSTLPDVQESNPDGELHEEIVASQNARANIWNWKLVLVAGLAAVGLGLGIGTTPNVGAPLVLCCIPAVCAYADLLCSHLSIRNHIIGAWRRSRPRFKEFNDYEMFVLSLTRKGVGRLEPLAVYGSSIAANVGLLLVGLGKSGGRLLTFPTHGAVVVAGLMGLAATFLVWLKARKYHGLIDEPRSDPAPNPSAAAFMGSSLSHALAPQPGFSESNSSVDADAAQQRVAPDGR